MRIWTEESYRRSNGGKRETTEGLKGAAEAAEKDISFLGNLTISDRLATRGSWPLDSFPSITPLNLRRSCFTSNSLLQTKYAPLRSSFCSNPRSGFTRRFGVDCVVYCSYGCRRPPNGPGGIDTSGCVDAARPSSRGSESDEAGLFGSNADWK